MKNLKEILNTVPIGTELYTSTHGSVKLSMVTCESIYLERINGSDWNKTFPVDIFGRISENGECILWPSQKEKSWKNYQILDVDEFDKATNLIDFENWKNSVAKLIESTKKKLNYYIDRISGESMLRIFQDDPKRLKSELEDIVKALVLLDRHETFDVEKKFLSVLDDYENLSKSKKEIDELLVSDLLKLVNINSEEILKEIIQICPRVEKEMDKFLNNEFRFYDSERRELRNLYWRNYDLLIEVEGEKC